MGQPGFRYANLAVRGKLLNQIAADQIPVAEQLRPDLITFCAGGNDIIKPQCDPDALATRFDQALGRLAATGAEVVIFTGFDTRRMPILRRLRGRIATYNELLRASADKHGSRVVDLWGMTVLADPRAWCNDRLHMTAEGHRRVALRVLEVLGVPVTEDWRAPWPAAVASPWAYRRQQDLIWARQYLMPHLSNWLRGIPTGEGFLPKRPELAPLEGEPPVGPIGLTSRPA
jgi:lysophospholipase L1-like esterase